MKLEEIKRIIENKGETLTKDLKKADLKKGFMVSLEGTESQVQDTDYKAINQAIADKKEIIKDRDNLYIGLWLDNNIMYIDISINIQDKTEALEFAKYNRQLAIYDLASNDSIYLRDYNFIKYYSLYEVIRDKNGDIIDYKIREQRENIQLFKSINASTKTLLNATYKSIEDIKDDSRLIDSKYLIIRDFEVVL
ncbi:MAG: hypothetical protein MST00_06550 [Tenericutes bacterium]|nr:hypothetical protein [Mycoplasmatota bacterium]